MPVDVAMQEPRARIVRSEAEGNVIGRTTDVHDVSPDGVVVIVFSAAGHTDDIEIVAMQVHRVL